MKKHTISTAGQNLIKSPETWKRMQDKSKSRAFINRTDARINTGKFSK
jgi:hypothetical protein